MSNTVDGDARHSQGEITWKNPLTEATQVDTTIGRLRRDSGYLSVEETCLFLGNKKSFVYRLMQQKLLPYHKIGRARYCKVDDLATLIAAQRHEVYRQKGRHSK